MRHPTRSVPRLPSPKAAVLAGWCCAALVWGAAPAWAAPGQWKWRDATGQVQYSDVPPPASVRDDQILGRPHRALNDRGRVSESGKAAAPLQGGAPTDGAASRASGPSAGVDPELERRRKKAEAEKAEQLRADETRQRDERNQQCEQARRYQQSLDNGSRIARTGASGERELLEGQARAEEQARNREAIERNCR